MRGDVIRATQLRLAVAGLILGGAGIFTAPAVLLISGGADSTDFWSGRPGSASESRSEGVESGPGSLSWKDRTLFHPRTY